MIDKAMRISLLAVVIVVKDTEFHYKMAHCFMCYDLAE